MNQIKSHLNWEIDTAGIATVCFDMHDSSVNVLSNAVADEALALFAKLGNDAQVRGVLITSGKKDSFIVGADVKALAACSSSREATEMSRFGQKAMQALANLHERYGKPVLAAIHGNALGGGLELLLACSQRLASNAPCTRLGLPEVKLGLLPGAGGTQRLPQLIGVRAALDLILTGKTISASKAKQLKLVDEVVPAPLLQARAYERLYAIIYTESKTKAATSWQQKALAVTRLDYLQQLALEENPVGLHLVFKSAFETVQKNTRGNYPAPKLALDCVRIGLSEGQTAGFAAEADRFGQLAISKPCKALTQLFLQTQALKKATGIDVALKKDTPAKDINFVGVLGGGLMGAGIAAITMREAKYRTRLKEVDVAALNRAYHYVGQIFAKDVHRRRLTEVQRDIAIQKLTGTLDWRGMQQAQIIIEAVFEDVQLKQRMLADVEAHSNEEVIFASNTSAIPIMQIAQEAKHPERVIGMHYFSPVEKMPLLEIVVTDKTAPWVIQSCVQLGKKQGKTVIVVGDGVGFYTSRILTPYMAEAAWLLCDGAAIDTIDEVAMNTGFPVGPMTLLDEVGMDVGAKVMHTMQQAFGERIKAPPALSTLLVSGRRGRKNGQGFYTYNGGKKGKVDATVYAITNQQHEQHSFSSEEIRHRLLLPMVNEAVRCLQEGILRDVADGDIGAVMGLGFPPFLGGPFHYIDEQGAATVVGRLQKLSERLGSRFTPAELLCDMAKSGKRFYKS